jgi:DivIVA domain-containing protein
MGILENVAGWEEIGLGAVFVGSALRQVVRARQGEARSSAIPSGAWARFLIGLSGLVLGVLFLRQPPFARGIFLALTALALTGAGLMLWIEPWIVSRSRARGLGPSPAEIPDPDPVIAPPDSTAGLIERIKNVKFHTVRLTPGYDEEEVDNFLDELVAILSHDGQLYRSRLNNARFSTTRIRPGYAIPDVDAFLDEVAQDI